jgi:hypothetical protein
MVSTVVGNVRRSLIADTHIDVIGLDIEPVDSVLHSINVEVLLEQLGLR